MGQKYNQKCVVYEYIEGRRGGVEQLDSEFESRREEEADFEMIVKLQEVGFVNE